MNFIPIRTWGQIVDHLALAASLGENVGSGDGWWTAATPLVLCLAEIVSSALDLRINMLVMTFYYFIKPDVQFGSGDSPCLFLQYEDRKFWTLWWLEVLPVHSSVIQVQSLIMSNITVCTSRRVRATGSFWTQRCWWRQMRYTARRPRLLIESYWTRALSCLLVRASTLFLCVFKMKQWSRKGPAATAVRLQSAASILVPFRPNRTKATQGPKCQQSDPQRNKELTSVCPVDLDTVRTNRQNLDEEFQPCLNWASDSSCFVPSGPTVLFTVYANMRKMSVIQKNRLKRRKIYQESIRKCFTKVASPPKGAGHF